MKKILKIFYSILAVTILSTAFSSCDSDDDSEGPGNGLAGWYVCKHDVAQTTDFNSINNAINTVEVMEESGGYKYFATRDKFFTDGAWDDDKYYLGKYRNSINTYIKVIQIIDDSTLIEYWASLYESGYSKESVVYKLYGGKHIGDLDYCGEGRVYTYMRSENKIIIPDKGSIYSIINGGLLMDGYSMDEIMEKYDPNKRYGDEQKSEGTTNNSDDTKIKQLIAQNVTVNAYYFDFIWTFNITSTLHNALPGKKIQFGIGHGVIEDVFEYMSVEDDAFYYSYNTSGNEAYITFKNPFWYYYVFSNPSDTDLAVECAFYYETYRRLYEKGLSNLTDGEYKQYHELKKILKEQEAPIIYSYKPSIEILIDNKFYIVDRYSL